MTQTIEQLKQVAQEYGLQLHPVKGLRSHCLFHGRDNKGHYRDMQLEGMTEAEFIELCESAVKPIEPQPFNVQAAMLQAYVANGRARSPITGHFRGGGR